MKITYGDKVFNANKGDKICDILKDEIKDNIVCICNNMVQVLDFKIEEDSVVELIGVERKEGRAAYIRGLLYILGKAFAEVYPDAWLTVNYQLHNSMFCQLDNMEVTDEILNNIKAKMEDIINKDLSIKKCDMTLKEAKAFYEEGRKSRGRLQVRESSEKVSLYFCEDYYNYLYGPLPLSTGKTKIFDLMKYKDGFLLRYPDKTKPNCLSKYKETKKLLSTLEEYDEINRLLYINTVYRLNNKVKKGETEDVILLSEALHNKKISNLADSIAKKKDAKMILIAGPSSSGKTTFARKLALNLKLNGLRPITISVDNYFVERENNPVDEFGNYDFECIEAIDIDLFNDHLTKLLSGKEIEVPTFDFSLGKKFYDGTTMKMGKDDILVIEGIHCLNDKLTASIDKSKKVKIYISDLTVLNIDYFSRISTTDTRLIRRIVRDHNFRNYTALNTLKSWYSVNRGEEKYIYPFQEEADFMFNSSLVYELAVLKKHALPLLEQIDNTHKEYGEAQRLIELLKYFDDIPDDDIPDDSLLREFIGGSIYHRE
ncbi:MAG: nucleoside kinase [Clostridia bacterium]|nr:nucleoside kinase [Clostridia bacterium]